MSVDEKTPTLQRSADALGSKMRAALGWDAELLRQRCKSEAAQACVEVALAAKSCGLTPEQEASFCAESIEVEAALDSSKLGWVRGSCLLRRGSHGQERDFEGPADNAPALAAKAMLRCLMERHSWLAEGLDDALDLSEHAADEMPAMLAMARRCAEAGGYAAVFADTLRQEARWNHPRWLARMDLEDRIKHCAKQGLLPEAFLSARVSLDGGLPGEPTYIVSISCGSAHGYGRSHEALAERDLRGETVRWVLPSLDQGGDALWDALSEKIASLHARRWPGVGAEIAPEAFYALHRTTMEREDISGSTREPSVASPKPRSL